MTTWRDLTPQEAALLNLTERPDLHPPLTERGEPCPWPWWPQQLPAERGQVTCTSCGTICAAGQRHPDHRDVYETGILTRLYGVFGTSEIERRAKEKPRLPEIELHLSGTPRSAAVAVSAVLRAMALAGNTDAPVAFLRDIASAPDDVDITLHAIAQWVTIR